MTEKKKNIPLVVALSIPVFMIVVIAISIYLPALFIKPQFDFIYGTGRYGYCNYRYSVQNGKIVQKEINDELQNNVCRNQRDPRLYYYDAQSSASREITFDQARQYTLDSRAKSPDGFEVVRGSRSFDVFFFSTSSYYNRYLKKGAFSRRVLDSSYYNDFQFMGWIRE